MTIPASVSDYQTLARRRLPRLLADYIDGGSIDEVTLAANRNDFLKIRLRQRVMRDVSKLDTCTTVLGQKLKMPLLLGPVGLAGMMARRGEAQAAHAAHQAGIPFCLSTLSICSLEEVHAAAGAPPWFQLYMMRDRGYARELLQRAQAACSPALIVTVDLALIGTRYSSVRNGMEGGLSLGGKLARACDIAGHPGWLRKVALGGRPLRFGNLSAAVPEPSQLTPVMRALRELKPSMTAVPQLNPALQSWFSAQSDPSITWSDLAWVRDNWPGPLVIKGVLEADDARAAADLGASAVVVSNHGGRQLDSVPSTIAALPEIVDALAGRAEVLMDGGIRSGQDISKALALGARAVLIGRPWVWALAAAGRAGVSAILANLRRELEVAMALQGITNVAQFDRSLLHHDSLPEFARAGYT